MTLSIAEEFDRVVLASFQPDKARAAKQLASATVKALTKVTNRNGFVIIQLDELIEGGDVLFSGVPFLPADPVAVCLTGTPRLIACLASAMSSSSSKARFAKVRSPGPVPVLRVGAFARDGTITLDANREFGGTSANVLSEAKWKVSSSSEEEGLVPELFEAEQILADCAGQCSTPFTPTVAPPKALKSHSGRRVRAKRPSCPNCGGTKVLPIAYGLPTPEGEAAARAGKLILGGCIVEPDQPDWYCDACEFSWPDDRRARPDSDDAAES
jgi:hypothetical protein